jgi:eukaryotic-like serine/threonine-protein kinase
VLALKVVIQVGDVLREKYRIDSLIGRGGMGEVFAAIVEPSVSIDESLAPGRRVAIKVVSRRVVGETLMARLQREAIAAVRVRSDFVPRVLDVDTTEEGEVFLVMELLRGQTLAERLRRRQGSLTWEEVASIGEDVLQGLIDAHAAGVIHRDLKPSNIFLETRSGPGLRERAKILDFGVCKLDTPDDEKLTTTGESVGTVAYMAPEQARGASRVDERADLYSFACVIFESLSGRLAHDGPGQMALLASKLEHPAMHLTQTARVPFPPALDALLACLLEKSPENRPTSAMAVLGAWRELGPATAEAETLAELPIEEAPLQPTHSGLSSGTMTRLGKRPSMFGALMGVSAVLFAGGLLALMVGARSPSARTADGTPIGSAQPVGASATSEGSANADPASSVDPARAAVPGGPGRIPPGPQDLVSIPTVEIPESTPPSLELEAGSAQVAPRGAKGGHSVMHAGPFKKSSTSEPHITDKPRY